MKQWNLSDRGQRHYLNFKAQNLPASNLSTYFSYLFINLTTPFLASMPFWISSHLLGEYTPWEPPTHLKKKGMWRRAGSVAVREAAANLPTWLLLRLPALFGPEPLSALQSEKIVQMDVEEAWSSRDVTSACAAGSPGCLHEAVSYSGAAIQNHSTQSSFILLFSHGLSVVILCHEKHLRIWYFVSFCTFIRVSNWCKKMTLTDPTINTRLQNVVSSSGWMHY